MKVNRIDYGLVSIITPCFNSEKTIFDAYKSIESQTYKNWEWIVVDDCSTDNTLSILNFIAEGKDNVIVIKMDTNSGAAKCRNEAIKRAKGRFIAFLDSDDLWNKEKLLLQCSFMQNNKIEFSYTNYSVFGQKRCEKYYIAKHDSLSYKQLLRHCDIGCLTVVYDRDLLGTILMPEEAEKREDYATWLSITKSGIIAKKLNLVLAKYRLTNNSVSRNKIKLIKYHWNVYRKCENLSIFKSLFYISFFILNKLFFKY